MTNFEKIEEICKEIFKDSFVCVEMVNNTNLRHIYLSLNLQGEQIKKLESKFKILFVSHGYDEDEKRIGTKILNVIVVSQLDTKPLAQLLRELIKDIKEIPDGEVDRYLIIDEIERIIKESTQ